MKIDQSLILWKNNYDKDGKWNSKGLEEIANYHHNRAYRFLKSVPDLKLLDVPRLLELCGRDGLNIVYRAGSKKDELIDLLTPYHEKAKEMKLVRTEMNQFIEKSKSRYLRYPSMLG